MKTYEIISEFWTIKVEARHELEALSKAQKQSGYFPLNSVKIKEKQREATS